MVGYRWRPTLLGVAMVSHRRCIATCNGENSKHPRPLRPSPTAKSLFRHVEFPGMTSRLGSRRTSKIHRGDLLWIPVVGSSLPPLVDPCVYAVLSGVIASATSNSVDIPCNHCRARGTWKKSTPRRFEPLRAEPNGFRVHLPIRSDTVSCQHGCGYVVGCR